jgi:hypothetical protein
MEIWKDIKDYEGKYQVSNLGKVKSLNYLGHGKEKILIPFNTLGYDYIRLSKNGKNKNFAIHRLVYQAFNGELINGLVIDHISGIRTENISENLQQITPRANTSKGKNCENKSSKYVGVYWYKPRNRWRAIIRINGPKKNLGNFKTELEAHEAYQKALKNI